MFLSRAGTRLAAAFLRRGYATAAGGGNEMALTFAAPYQVISFNSLHLSRNLI